MILLHFEIFNLNDKQKRTNDCDHFISLEVKSICLIMLIVTISTRKIASHLDDSLPVDILHDLVSHMVESYGLSGFMITWLLPHHFENLSDRKCMADFVPPPSLVVYLIEISSVEYIM
jgi:hypothetical protein